MRRTLKISFVARLALALALLLGFAGQSHANNPNINWNDPKAVEAYVNRLAEERLKPFQAQTTQQQQRGEQMLRALQQAQAANPNAPGPNLSAPSLPSFSGLPALTAEGTMNLSCKVSGCSGEICAPDLGGGQTLAGTCEFMSFYACYQGAACVKAKDSSGKTDICRWQDTPELRACLQSKGGNTALMHAGFITPTVP